MGSLADMLLERQMFAWIRAIYLPIAFHADENFELLSTWVQINFALNRTVNIWNGRTLVNNTQQFRLSSTYGLPVTGNRTLGIDVHGLMNLLCIPRQLRRDNAYGLRLLKVVDRTTVTTVPLSKTYSSDWDISWLTVSRANFGLDLQWRPAPKQSNWFWQWFGRLATHLLGLIPVIGPFLAIGFPIAWALITDPDNVYQIFRETFPLVDLTDHMVRRLRDSAMETRKYLPDGWDELTLPQARSSRRLIASRPKSLEEIGPSVAFMVAEEILSKSATNEWRTDQPDDQDELGEAAPITPPIEEIAGTETETETALEKNDNSDQKPATTIPIGKSGYSDENIGPVETNPPHDENLDPNDPLRDAGDNSEQDKKPHKTTK